MRCVVCYALQMEQEVWKPIAGFEESYEISSLGRLKSVARTVSHKKNGTRAISENITEGAVAATGKYRVVHLWRDGKRTTKYVHSLVLEAFAGERPKGADCCHCDGDRLNNRKENLRWDTRKGNFADMDEHGTRILGRKRWNAVLNESIIRAIRDDQRPQAIIGREYGISQGKVSSIKSRRVWGWVQ